MKGVDSGMSNGPYFLVLDAFRESKSPCFILLGDSYYHYCSNPESGWKIWESYFMPFYAKHWVSTKSWVSNVILYCYSLYYFSGISFWNAHQTGYLNYSGERSNTKRWGNDISLSTTRVFNA